MEKTENDERRAPTSRLTEAGFHTSLNQAGSDLEALISSSPVGVLVVDAETRVVLSVNCEAERITGVPSEPGITLDQYREAMNYRRTCGNEVATEEFPLERALAQGETVRAQQFEFHHAGGETLTALINAAPIHSQDGRILSAAAVIQDITPLEELKRMRSESLSMMSQELRLPLTAIKGSTAMALGSPSPPDSAETRHLFQIIDGQVNLLRSLINDFLDMTRAETGAPSSPPESADAAGLIEHAKSAFLRGGAKNRIEVDIPPNLPRIRAGRQRILQVLDKLLARASSHSPEASTIRVAASETGFNVAVSVTDESRGVSAEHLPNLFEESWTDREDRKGKEGGEGQGLAICKGLVNAHGGRIWAESDGPDGGTRITFTVPVAGRPEDPHPALPPRWARGKEREPVPGFEDPPHLLPAETPPPYRLKDLTIDYDERSVTAAGRQVQLTATEYKLIFELSVNAGRVLTHRQLVDRVWGSDHTGDTQILRAFVKDIRKKLGDDARNPTYIFTLPRVGYRMAKPA